MKPFFCHFCKVSSLVLVLVWFVYHLEVALYGFYSFMLAISLHPAIGHCCGYCCSGVMGLPFYLQLLLVLCVLSNADFPGVLRALKLLH